MTGTRWTDSIDGAQFKERADVEFESNYNTAEKVAPLHNSVKLVFNFHRPPSITGDTYTWIYNCHNALNVEKSFSSQVVSISTVASLFLIAFSIVTFFVQVLVITTMRGLMIYPMVRIWVWIHITKIWR